MELVQVCERHVPLTADGRWLIAHCHAAFAEVVFDLVAVGEGGGESLRDF
jgi:hypothetical protein